MKIIFRWIMGVLLGLLPLNLQGLDYVIQDLGTLANEESYAKGINNQNSIVGYVKQRKDTTDFIWKPGQGLVSLPHPSYQMPFINNHDQVASIFWYKTNYWLVKNTHSKHVYIYNSDGSIQVLGVPKQWEIQKLEDWQTPSAWDKKELGVLAFNDNQQILISNSSQANKATQFAIWQNGTFKELDTKVISNAYGINNQGLILGRKWVQNEKGISLPMLVLYNPIEGTIIEIMKDINVVKRQLNDLGQVIVFQALNESIFKGSLWDPQKGLKDLEDFAPLALNNSNQIVGFQISELQNKKMVPLLWTSGEVVSLAPFIGLNSIESMWRGVTSLDGINDNGYIIGQGIFDGKKHAFVLIPQ